MRTLFTALSMLITISAAHAADDGPFGIPMGTPADALGIIEETPSGAIYIKPPKEAHPAFEIYSVFAPKETGVCKVQGITPNISTSVYGDELKRHFIDLRDALSNVYGKGKHYDFLRHGSIWNEPRDWMMGLVKKERVLASFWSSKQGSKMKGDITGVTLEALPLGRDAGFVIIRYELANFDKCSKALNPAKAGKL